MGWAAKPRRDMMIKNTTVQRMCRELFGPDLYVVFYFYQFLADVPLRIVSAEDDRSCKGEISDGPGAHRPIIVE